MNNFIEKYFIIEIFEKLVRIKNFINANKDILNKKGNKITLNVFEKAFEKVLQEIETPIKIIDKYELSLDLKESIYRRLAITLTLISEFHSLLKYVNSDWVRPETYTFTNRILLNLPIEYHKTKINVILINEYSFKENNLVNKFNEVFGRSKTYIDETSIKSPTLFLPKIELSNPLNWAILAHEIGHVNTKEISSVINDSIIPPDTNTKNHDILLKWAEEIFCDIFAINILGPAYFSSLVSYSLVTGGLFTNNINSKKHPSNIFRIRFLYEYLERNGFKLRCNSALIGDTDLSEFYYNISEDIDKINRSYYKNQYNNNLNIPNTTYFLDRLREISKEYTTDIKYKSENNINELYGRLLRGIPIGSICETSQDAIKQKLKTKTKEDFIEAKRLISERGSELWEILNAGWIYKISIIIPESHNIIFKKSHNSLYEKVSEISQLYNLCDDRLLRSIEASEIHNLIEKHPI